MPRNNKELKQRKRRKLMIITVELIETHNTEEKYTIGQLPDNWDELDRRDKYSYVSEHGEFVDSESECFLIDDVVEVKEEGDRLEYAKDFVFVDFTKEGN